MIILVDDVMLRLLHGTDGLRCHCFDGASNMSGGVSGVQARITNKPPKSMFVHCSNHALDLALVEEAKEVESSEMSLNWMISSKSFKMEAW